MASLQGRLDPLQEATLAVRFVVEDEARAELASDPATVLQPYWKDRRVFSSTWKDRMGSTGVFKADANVPAALTTSQRTGPAAAPGRSSGNFSMLDSLGLEVPCAILRPKTTSDEKEIGKHALPVSRDELPGSIAQPSAMQK
eukprot:g10452.t1